MIQYVVVRNKEKRVAAVLVEKKRMGRPDTGTLIFRLEQELSLPVMLVSPDDTALAGAKAYAEFDPLPFLYELLRMRDVEWATLACEPCCTEGD